MPLSVEDQGGKIVMANDAISFTFSLRHGRFIVRRAGGETLPALLNATAQAVYKSGLRSTTVRMDQPGKIVWNDAPGRDVHGTGHHSLFYWTGDEARLGLTVVMYDSLPYMLLRISLIHKITNPLTLESLTPVLAESKQGGGLRFAEPPGSLAFFRNGWNSWSPAGRATSGEVPLDTQFVKHARTAFLNANTPAGSRSELWGEAFTIIGPPAGAGAAGAEAGAPSGPPGERIGLVAGFVSLADQFTAIGLDLAPAAKSAEPPVSTFQMVCQCDQISLPPDTSLASEWTYLQWADLSQDDVLAEYTLATARQMEARIPVRGPVGWSSWHQVYDKAEEQHITTALKSVAELRETLPIELVQLDAGYADIPGDWMQTNSTKFPHGMAWLSEQIRSQGCTPGIWLAPFVVHPDSLIAADHPDWLLKDGSGRPVSAGLLAGANVFALDTTHPQVAEWLSDLIRRIRREWGFPCINLDFLYAAALPGKHHDAGMTRAQALRRALQLIREVAGPDTFLLASGCPLGPAVGIVNAMRIGPDTAPAWYTRDSRWAPIFKPGPAMPGLRNALRNTLTRSALHRRWWLNDPDALVLRAQDGEASGLSEAEARSLASVVGLSGGLLLFGDALGQVETQRLALAAPLLPEIQEFATAHDLLEHEMPERYLLRLDRPWSKWSVVGVFNWEDTPRDLIVRLDEVGLDGSRPLHLYDFWTRQYHRLTTTEFLLPQVPAHGGHVLGLRPMVPGAHLVASSFHISQGGEISAWEATATGLSFTLALGRRADGEVLLWTATAIRQASSEGRSVPVVDLGGGVSALRLSVAKAARVEVTLS